MCCSFIGGRESDILVTLGIAPVRTNAKHMQFLKKGQQKKCLRITSFNSAKTKIKLSAPSFWVTAAKYVNKRRGFGE